MTGTAVSSEEDDKATVSKLTSHLVLGALKLLLNLLLANEFLLEYCFLLDRSVIASLNVLKRRGDHSVERDIKRTSDQDVSLAS